MKELRVFFLKCETVEDFLLFQEFAYKEIEKIKGCNEGCIFGKDLNTVQFANRLIELSHVRLKNILAS